VNINISVNNGSEKLFKKKNTADFGKLIRAVQVAVVHVYNIYTIGNKFSLSI